VIGRWHAKSNRHSNSCRNIRVSSVLNHRTNRWNLFYGSLDDEYFTQQIGHTALPIDGKIRSPEQNDYQVNRSCESDGQRFDKTRCNDKASSRYASRLGSTGQKKPRGCEARLNLHPEHEEAYLSDIKFNSEQTIDLLKEISDNTKQAAESSAEILKLLSAIREE